MTDEIIQLNEDYRIHIVTDYDTESVITLHSSRLALPLATP